MNSTKESTENDGHVDAGRKAQVQFWESTKAEEDQVRVQTNL